MLINLVDQNTSVQCSAKKNVYFIYIYIYIYLHIYPDLPHKKIQAREVFLLSRLNVTRKEIAVQGAL